jgi:hypothetical protein
MGGISESWAEPDIAKFLVRRRDEAGILAATFEPTRAGAMGKMRSPRGRPGELESDQVKFKTSETAAVFAAVVRLGLGIPPARF